MKDCTMTLKNPILVLLTSMIVHDHFRASSLGQAVAIAALCATYAYNLYLDSKKEAPINEEVKKELQELRGAITSLKINKVFGR
jgi:hypothetical protein